MNKKRDIELLFEIGCFRFVQRTWKRFMNPDVANCAEHTFRVVWIALTVAKYEKNVNHEKLLKMALMHDLAESRTGDVDYLSRQYTQRNERQAEHDLFSGTVHEDELMLLEEYAKRESIESKIVKDADILDVELELIETKSRGHSMGTIWTKDRKDKVYPKLYTQSAKKMWEDMHKANPHDWHLNGRNRFTKGDLKK
jgi:putative hydrolases of HD superfamily